MTARSSPCPCICWHELGSSIRAQQQTHHAAAAIAIEIELKAASRCCGLLPLPLGAGQQPLALQLLQAAAVGGGGECRRAAQHQKCGRRAWFRVLLLLPAVRYLPLLLLLLPLLLMGMLVLICLLLLLLLLLLLRLLLLLLLRLLLLLLMLLMLMVPLPAAVMWCGRCQLLLLSLLLLKPQELLFHMPLQLLPCRQQQAAQRAGLLQRLRGRLRVAGGCPLVLLVLVLVLVLLLMSLLKWKRRCCWHICGQLAEHRCRVRITWRRSGPSCCCLPRGCRCRRTAAAGGAAAYQLGAERLHQVAAASSLALAGRLGGGLLLLLLGLGGPALAGDVASQVALHCLAMVYDA